MNSRENEVNGPLLAYTAEGEVMNVSWSMLQVDWMSLCFNKQLQIVKVY